ncbi:hypothetical protein MHYP_G00066770 [Metynnis hypsauchen]
MCQFGTMDCFSALALGAHLRWAITMESSPAARLEAHLDVTEVKTPSCVSGSQVLTEELNSCEILHSEHTQKKGVSHDGRR